MTLVEEHLIFGTELGDGVFQVLATNGDTRLGGDDFDEAIIHWMV